MRVTARHDGFVPQAAGPATASAQNSSASQYEEPAVEFGSDAGAGKSPVAEVAIVPPADAGDDVLVARIVELVNRVYAEAERGLWRDGADRTDAPGIEAIIQAGELAVARVDGRLAGAVRIRRLDPGLAEFGMLVASPEHRGIGIGRALVAFAEDWARQQGLGRMQLEVLTPRTWTHPAKEFLREWYTRIGYRQIRTGRLAEAYPALQPRLATPCDFAVYHKKGTYHRTLPARSLMGSAYAWIRRAAVVEVAPADSFQEFAPRHWRDAEDRPRLILAVTNYIAARHMCHLYTTPIPHAQRTLLPIGIKKVGLVERSTLLLGRRLIHDVQP